MEDAAPDPTRIIAIRHGETDWNAAARIQGHTDIALNARGLEQARLAAAALADEPVAAVYASDLQRAWQTAEAIAARGLRLAGWIANRIDPQMAHPQTSIDTLHALLPAPFLGDVPHGVPPAAAAELLDLGPLFATDSGGL